MRELSLSEIGMVSGGAGAVVEGVVMGTGLVQLLGGKYCRKKKKKKSCLTSPQIL